MFRSPALTGRAGSAVNAMRAVAAAVAFAAVGMAAGPAAAAGPGTLDGSFGSGGIASTGGGTRLFGDAVQSDGKTVAVGETLGSTPTLLLARFLPDGRLDTSFGSGGIVHGPTTVPGGPASIGRGVAIEPDGKIVVVGKAAGSDGSATNGLIVERYNANGTLDTSFGDHGWARFFGGSFGDGDAVAVASDGTIVATGSSNAAGSGGTAPRAALVRLSANGQPDSTFGTGGSEVVDLGAYSYALSVALQSDGKIVIAGSQAPGLQVPNALIARFLPSGALDTSFAGTGAYAHQYAKNGGASSAFNAVAIQRDGRIVAAGAAADGSSGADAIVARFTSAGAVDTSFGTGGVAYAPSATNLLITGNSVPGADGAVIASNGDIVAGGQIVNRLSQIAAAWAFTPAGTLDGTFGSGGVATAPVGSNNSSLAALALAPDGGLIGVGDAAPIATTQYAGIAVRWNGFGGAPPPPTTSRIGLMGRMGFVSPGGVIGVQVGCFNGQTRCTGHIEMTHNGTIVGATNFNLAPESGGFQNLKLTSAGRDLLKGNHRFHLLAVQVRVTGSGNQTLNQVMHLARWVWGNGSGNASTTSGPLPGPLAPKGGTSRIGLMGRMGFVSPGGVIGVQVGCFNGQTRCTGHIEMTHDGTVVGRTDFDLAPESGGFQNLGLTAEGSHLLGENRARRLLAVQVVVTGDNGQRIAEVMHLAGWIWT